MLVLRRCRYGRNKSQNGHDQKWRRFHTDFSCAFYFAVNACFRDQVQESPRSFCDGFAKTRDAGDKRALDKRNSPDRHTRVAIVRFDFPIHGINLPCDISMLPTSAISEPRILERPPCPMCGATMRLIWIEPDRQCRDRHTLECRRCTESIEVIVERDVDW